jgi:hypothetical protein
MSRACASRTSAGQLRAPSSRAIASCASASRSTPASAAGRTPEHALARGDIARARRGEQRLGLAPRAGQIDRPSVHHDHLRRAGGPQHGRRSIERAGTWPSRHRGGPGALPADRVRPRAREQAIAGARAPQGPRRRAGLARTTRACPRSLLGPRTAPM